MSAILSSHRHETATSPGLNISERRVGRLMRINGIKPVRTRKHKITTNSNHSLGIVANVLDGNFVADAPNRNGLVEAKLNGSEAVGHISYIWTAQGWLYLAVILDLHSRRVVALRRTQEGGQRSDDPKGRVANKDLAIQALDMAVRLRNSPEGCIFHSDRGSQHCAYEYQKKLQA